MREIGLKLAIKTVIDVLMTTGVYPQATITVDKDSKETKREERTPWQEGWNACQWEIFNKINDSLGKLEKEGISDELALLMIADVGWLQDGKFILNMNDTFWGCADAEEANEEEVKEIARLFSIYGYKGITYWVAKKRGYDPEIPRYKSDVEEIRRVEEKYVKEIQENEKIS